MKTEVSYGLKIKRKMQSWMRKELSLRVICASSGKNVKIATGIRFEPTRREYNSCRERGTNGESMSKDTRFKAAMAATNPRTRTSPLLSYSSESATFWTA